MPPSHDHARPSHSHARPPRVDAGISLLRLSAGSRIGIAFALSGLVWLIVLLVMR